MASILAVTVFSIATAPLAQDAFAAGSNGNFWGQASSDLAKSGEMGSHSSSFGTPRTGLGNLFGGDWCGLIFALTGFNPCSP